MTILTINKERLEKKFGKMTPDFENKISMMGTPVEEITDNEVSVEIFPNRPDLLSAGNFMRAIGQFVRKRKVVDFRVAKPKKDFVVTIDKSVKVVRPHTVCVVVKGLRFDDARIKEIVDIQEKLHGSIGRNRKKLAIGIYPLDKIKMPIRFVGRKPEEIKFVPLEAKGEMNGNQILRGHPAGREYGDLLKDADVFPVFVDADDEILSMPPIINSERTGRVDEKTRDVFVECSGYNLVYLKKCLNIIVSALSEMGGKIYGVSIKDSKDGGFVSPDMSPEKIEFKIENIERTLGVKLSEKDVRQLLAKMGIGLENQKGKFFALVPAYRADVLHWIDLAEDIAIAYGYDKFVPEIPKISTIAEEDSVYRKKKVVAEILAGLGFLECSNFHLDIKKDVKKMHYDFNDFVEIEDSKTGRDVLRIDLMSGLLKIFSENSDASFPQKIFELGEVFSLCEKGISGSRGVGVSEKIGVVEEERLAIAIANERVGFTEMKQVVDYLFKMLGLEYLIEDVEDSNYIVGRCGRILVGDPIRQGSNGARKEVGRIGEIAPRVLKNWKIRNPVVGMEIGIDFLT